MEQLIAELEVLVGERTQKEQTELLGLKEAELNRLIKYAKLAAFYKGQQIFKEQQTAVVQAKPFVPDDIEAQVESPAPKSRRK